MNSNEKRLSVWICSLVIAVGWIALLSVTASFAKPMDKEAPAISYAFNDSPEHQALVKLLKELGEDQMLQSAYSVAMSKGQDFADVIIGYYKQEEPAETEFYLFKENDAWVAYKELPAQKDHYAVFSTLAKDYCKPLYKNLQGVAMPGESWKIENKKIRNVDVICSELIDNQWQDHRLTLVYEYDASKGWHITGQRDTDEASTSVVQKESAAQPKVVEKVIWGDAKEAIGGIIQSIGGNPEPVFIVFGTTGQDSIQFHYVTEKGGKDIQTIDWNNGKLSDPKTSRLARPCPPIPFKEIDFDLVSKIFAETRKKAMQGDMINVNLGRRFTNGCQEPIWQGIATSGKHSLTITYSIDGDQVNIEEYNF